MDAQAPCNEGRSARRQLVVVGNGMAAMRTVEELLAVAPELYDITVFGAEPHPNYNRIMLSPVLAGEQTVQDIILHPLSWYDRHGITLHLGQAVTAVDRTRRVVTAANGTQVPYDRLLMATGSRPFVLPVPGHDLRGVVTYRDIADTRHMIDASTRERHAVVIGGGLLGLEAANGLNARGMSVTVVHLGPWLLERQLDRRAATLLQAELARRGLKFVLQAHTAACIGDAQGHVRAVTLKDGQRLQADLVVMAAGIRPEVQLASAMGLQCERGIRVHDSLQTLTDPRIYAVGECANHRGTAYGLVAPAYEQAAVCANHLADRGFARYGGSQVSAKLKVTGIELFSAGDFMGEAGTDTITLDDPVRGVYRKLVLRDDVLVGACLYGDTHDGPAYFDLIRDGGKLGERRDTLMFGVTDHGA